MPVRRHVPTKYEFSLNDGSTWTEIPEVVETDITVDPVQFEAETGHRFAQRTRMTVTLRSIGVFTGTPPAWFTSLKNAMDAGQRNIRLRITQAHGGTDTLLGGSVSLNALPARPDRPAMIEITFDFVGHDGRIVVYA